jgi:hypothetical protein
VSRKNAALPDEKQASPLEEGGYVDFTRHDAKSNSRKIHELK